MLSWESNFKDNLMKVNGSAHDFWILVLAVFNGLKGEPWALFKKGMQMIVWTNATENSVLFLVVFSLEMSLCMKLRKAS